MLWDRNRTWIQLLCPFQVLLSLTYSLRRSPFKPQTWKNKLAYIMFIHMKPKQSSTTIHVIRLDYLHAKTQIEMFHNTLEKLLSLSTAWKVTVKSEEVLNQNLKPAVWANSLNWLYQTYKRTTCIQVINPPNDGQSLQLSKFI